MTVLLSVYNGEQHLRQAIESILCQTLEGFEFLIINDGSTDNSAKIIRSYSDPRIRYVEHRNMGLARSLNKGIQLASSDLIARMDADDVAFRDRLERQATFLGAHPNHVLLGTGSVVIDSAGRRLKEMCHPTDDLELRWKLLFDNPFVHSTVVFRRPAALVAGGYAEADGNFVEDYDLWCRLSALGSIANLADPLLYYRDNPSGISHTRFCRQQEQATAVSARMVAALVGNHHADDVAARRMRGLSQGSLLDDGSEIRSVATCLASLSAHFFETVGKRQQPPRTIRSDLAHMWMTLSISGLRTRSWRLWMVFFAKALRASPLTAGELRYWREVFLTTLGPRNRSTLSAWIRRIRR